MTDLLSQSGLSLERLQSFCLVAAAGGVTKAAKGDAARQSQFSRQIKELEEFFGAELLRRSGRGVVLTAAGQSLHALAREQFAALGDFKAACGSEPVRLTLAAGDSWLHWMVMARLAEWPGRLPEVRLRLLNWSTLEIVGGLTEGTLDFGLVRADAVPAHLGSAALGRLAYALFVPRQLASSAAGGRLDAKGMGRLPLVTLEGEGFFRRELARLARRAKVALGVRLEVASFPLAARAVRTGAFAAVLPEVARGEFAADEVSELALPWLKPLARPMALAWNPRLAGVRPAMLKAVPVLQELCRI